LKIKSSYKDIWKVSYPIMLGAFSTTLLNLTDTAFMSRVGQVELAAMAIATIFHFVLYMIGYALATGAQILIARRAGEDRRDEIGNIFDHTIILLLCLGILTSLISFFLSPIILESILSSQRVALASSSYIQIRSLGLLIGVTGLAFRSFFVGIGRTSIITATAAGMVVMNIMLDFVFVVGVGIVEPMGIKGVAWATVIAETFSIAIIGIYPFLKERYRNYGLLSFSKLNSRSYKSIIHISSPLILQNLLSMSSWFVFFVLIEKMGEWQLAISNIVRAVYMVLMTPIWGFASAANSMVSNIIGQGKIAEVRTLVKKIIVLCLGSTVVLTVVDYFSGPFLLTVIGSDSKLIHDSMGSYHVIMATMAIFSVSVILLSAVSGTGNTKAAMVIEVIIICFYLLYVYLCTVLGASIEVTWMAEIVYWTLMGIFSLAYFKLYNWKNVTI
jgi:MATE family, multidrug efflux pump